MPFAASFAKQQQPHFGREVTHPHPSGRIMLCVKGHKVNASQTLATTAFARTKTQKKGGIWGCLDFLTRFKGAGKCKVEENKTGIWHHDFQGGTYIVSYWISTPILWRTLSIDIFFNTYLYSLEFSKAIWALWVALLYFCLNKINAAPSRRCIRSLRHNLKRHTGQTDPN